MKPATSDRCTSLPRKSKCGLFTLSSYQSYQINNNCQDDDSLNIKQPVTPLFMSLIVISDADRNRVAVSKVL